MHKQKLNLPTITCKVCFSPIYVRHLFQWQREPVLCSKCYHQLEWHHQINTFEGISIESFMVYGPIVKSRIHQYKALGDIELGQTFLHQHLDYLSVKYRGFTFLPAPSYQDHIVQRGFHHLDEILLPISLPRHHVFFKNKPYRQAEQDLLVRHEISDVIQRHVGISLPRKLLLFDDVMTTGETMRSMIKLLPVDQKFNLKIIVLARKIDTNSRLQSSSKMLK
jgi:competence protein ComFC